MRTWDRARRRRRRPLGLRARVVVGVVAVHWFPWWLPRRAFAPAACELAAAATSISTSLVSPSLPAAAVYTNIWMYRYVRAN